MKIKPCKYCATLGHFPYQCKYNPKPRKTITRYGRRAREYYKWRDDVAIPYLDSIGRKCALCGATGKLDVDHIAKRRMGGAPSRTMNLSNVRYLCRDCHIKVT